MQQNPWGANRSSASKEVLRILRSPASSQIHSQENSTCSYPRPSPRFREMFRNMKSFLQWELISTMRNSQVGGPPLIGCRQILTQYIHSYRPHRRQFLHPQSEDAPCCGDRDPLVMVCFRYSATNQQAEICSYTFYVIVIQMLRMSFKIHVS